MDWKNIKDCKPEENKPLFYYFDVFDKVYLGKYQETEYGDCFYGKKGFLTDDVDSWVYVPDNWDGVVPDVPVKQS